MKQNVTVRSVLLFAVCLLLAAPALAGTAPELDPSHLGGGLALAGAIVFVLADRRSRAPARKQDTEPAARDQSD